MYYVYCICIILFCISYQLLRRCHRTSCVYFSIIRRLSVLRLSFLYIPIYIHIYIFLFQYTINSYIYIAAYISIYWVHFVEYYHANNICHTCMCFCFSSRRRSFASTVSCSSVPHTL